MPRANRGDLQMQLSNESILVILFVGLVAGWLAGKIVRGTGFGIIRDILVGIAGALVASLLFPKLGIAIGSGLVREIIYSPIGAVILLLIVRLLRGGGRFLGGKCPEDMAKGRRRRHRRSIVGARQFGGHAPARCGTPDKSSRWVCSRDQRERPASCRIL